MNPLYQKHIISINDLSREELELVLETAAKLKANPQPELLKHKVIASCFFEASTRTRLSFETSGYAEGLVGRAADVVLKEGRKLVLVPRETPLSTIHLENMLALSRMGVAMVPPMPAYYNHPQTADDITLHIVTRVLDQFGLEHKKARRWNGLQAAKHFSQENNDGI